jgi:hypothetical protein
VNVQHAWRTSSSPAAWARIPARFMESDASTSRGQRAASARQTLPHMWTGLTESEPSISALRVGPLRCCSQTSGTREAHNAMCRSHHRSWGLTRTGIAASDRCGHVGHLVASERRQFLRGGS